MNKTYDYIIIGGGITGLINTYLLDKYKKNKKILLIEKNNSLGGVIKGDFKNKDKYIEHSLRVVFNNYNNFFKICKLIPEIKSHLKDSNNLIFSDNKVYKTDKLLYSYKIIFFSILFIVSLFTPKYILEKFNFVNMFRDKYIESFCNILGENSNNISWYKIQRLFEMYITRQFNKTYIFNGPIKNCLIDNIVSKFSKDVEIITNNELLNYDTINNTIQLSKGITYKYKNLILTYNMNKNHVDQHSVQINWKKRIELPKEITDYFVIVNDKYNLNIAPYELIWDNEYKINNSIWSMNITNEVDDVNKLLDEILNIINNELNLDLKKTDISNYSIKKIDYFGNYINKNKDRLNTGLIDKDVYYSSAYANTTFYFTYIESGIESAITLCNEKFKIPLKPHKYKRFFY